VQDGLDRHLAVRLPLDQQGRTLGIVVRVTGMRTVRHLMPFMLALTQGRRQFAFDPHRRLVAEHQVGMTAVARHAIGADGPVLIRQAQGNRRGGGNRGGHLRGRRGRVHRGPRLRDG